MYYSGPPTVLISTFEPRFLSACFNRAIPPLLSCFPHGTLEICTTGSTLLVPIPFLSFRPLFGGSGAALRRGVAAGKMGAVLILGELSGVVLNDEGVVLGVLGREELSEGGGGGFLRRAIVGLSRGGVGELSEVSEE